MARGYTSLVVGFHGCERSIGEKIVAGDVPFERSQASLIGLVRGYISGILMNSERLNGRSGSNKPGS